MGFGVRDLAEQIEAKPAEIRALLDNQLDPARLTELRDKMCCGQDCQSEFVLLEQGFQLQIMLSRADRLRSRLDDCCEKHFYLRNQPEFFANQAPSKRRICSICMRMPCSISMHILLVNFLITDIFDSTRPFASISVTRRSWLFAVA